ncbi:MAG: RagB/SusD family nutrient uptake outer membrane protein [Bacteroidales bacterium]
MKSILKKIILSSSIILSLTSCEDFLTHNKYGEPSSDRFWITESDALRAADGLYFWMGSTGVVGRGFMHYYNCSDDVVTGRTQAGCAAMKNFIANYSRDVVDNWPKMYQLIKLSNDIILNVPKMDLSQDTKDLVLGQAYFFRAWAYFWIAPYYGDNSTNGGIPIVEPGLAVDALDVPRANSVRDNYAYCIEDFKRAAELLPEFEQLEQAQWGRPHKAACWAYIAKVALWDAQYDASSYDTTIEYCDKLINAGKHSLMSNYEDIFKVENNYSSEYIFSFASSAISGSILPGAMLENKGWGEYNGWGYFTPTIELLNAYQSDDKRLAATILQPGDKFEYLGNEKLYYSNESLSGMQFRKYMDPFKSATAIGTTINPNGDYPTTSLNIPVLRYAEVLLMKAEAEIWSGKSGDESLNQIRRRAGLSDLQGATKEDLMNERRCELAGEFSNRMLDLLRWGVAKEYVEKPLHGFSVRPLVPSPQSKEDLEITVIESWPTRSFNASVNHIFPIPEKEIAKSKNLRQNIGY